MFTRISEAFSAVCVAVLLAVLASCGGGGGGTEVRIDNPPPIATTGTLTIRIVPPAGGSPVVRITSQNGYSQTFSQTQTVTGLAAGTYAISADPITADGIGYGANVSADSVAISGGEMRQVDVTYTRVSTPLITTTLFASGLEFPTFLTSPVNDPRQFITERPGRIRVVRDGVVLATPFLDISERVSTVGEGGLLAMEFSPDYSTTGTFYIYYTDLARNIVIERHTVSGNPDRADSIGHFEIIRIPHPNYTNHYGGLLAFGPDGNLYIGTGDGGGSGNPDGNAQNRNVLLGKMLRLDVRQASIAQPYRIPSGNPYAGQAGARPEIWAIGLRNPWRFTFDQQALIITDVGEDRAEEINVVASTRAGLNYGWDIMEGWECFRTSPCDQSGIETSWLEYTHQDTGGCSITGGFVYRGAALPELHGQYFYSDFCAGFLKSIGIDGNMASGPGITWPKPALSGIVSFGRDSRGELYLLSSSGLVHKIVRAGSWDYDPPRGQL